MLDPPTEEEIEDATRGYVASDGWLVGSPREEATRRYLIDDEQLPPDFADLVLKKMWDLGDPAWDDKPSFGEMIWARRGGK